MPDDRRIRRLVSRVVKRGDPHELDAAIRLLEDRPGSDRAALMAQMLHDRTGDAKGLRRVAAAWRERGVRITHDPADLDRAVAALERIPAEDTRARQELADILHLRYHARDDPADLERARRLADSAAGDSAEGRVILARILVDAPRGAEDLARAESLLAEAASLLPRSHEWRLDLLHDLARLQEGRFDRARDPQALDSAIDSWQGAADVAGGEHPSLPYYLTGVGQALRKRYESTGSPADVERSVRAMRQALEAAGPSHRYRTDYVSNLGTAYQDRYGFTEDPADLARAIELHEEALAHDEESSLHLANLGNALRLRYGVGREVADLVRSIELQDRALARERDGCSPRLLNHFGSTLRLRYQHEGDRADLLRAIDLHERALAVASAEDTLRPLFLGNLAADLRLLVAASADRDDPPDRADLDRTVDVHERLAAAVRESDTQAWLAWALLARYEAFGEEADLARAAKAADVAGTSSPQLTRRIRLHEASVRTHEAAAHADDDRRAFVISGRHAGRTRHLVVVFPADRPLVLAAVGEHPATAFFVDTWDQVDTDADLLIMTKVQEDGEGYSALSYPLPDHDPPDPEELAAEALTYSRRPPEVRGPYWVGWTGLSAFVISGHFAWGLRRIGVITSRPAHWWSTAQDEEAVRELFHSALYDNGAEAPLWINDSPVPLHDQITVPESLVAEGSSALAPSEFGRIVLTMATTYRHGDLTYHWVSPGKMLAHSVQYRMDDSEPWSVGELRDWPPGEEVTATKDEDWERTQQWYAGNYATDTLTAVREGRLIDAFHAFTLHIRLVEPGSTEVAMASLHCGATLLEALSDSGQHDLCLWVADRCAVLAGRLRLPTVQREFLRSGAIACEGQGLLNAALRRYDEALALPDDGAAYPVEREFSRWRVVIQRDLHLDYVTTSVSLLADYEPEGLYRAGLDPRAADLVATAQSHLAAAEQLLRAEPEETSRWARLAAQVYRWRIADLLGEHAEAVEHLDVLIGSPELQVEARLLASARVFRVAALRKLVDRDEAWAARYDAHLAEAEFDGGTWPEDRACVLEVLKADRLTERGELTEAFEWAAHALHLQLTAEKRRVAVPPPGEAHAGWMAIDVPARLNEIWNRMRHVSGETPETRAHFRICFAAVESAKSRWFRRDLRSGLQTLPDGSVVYQPLIYPAENLDELIVRASQLVRRPAAPPGRRKRRWAFKPGKPARQDAEPPAVAEAFPEGHTADLRRHLPKGTALLSFYLTAEHTYLTCLTPANTLTLRLPISARTLNRAVLALQAGFSGTGLYGRIDPAHPFDLDERLIEPVRALGWHLHPLAPLLRDAPLVLVAPHRAWHNIPIHALVLPQVWETGRCPAWSYVPSLGVAEDLFRRAARRPPHARTAAVLTAPGGAEEHEAFLSCHRRITELLRRGTVRAEGVFGSDATPDEVISTATRVDLLHTLAHGSHREGAEVMDSGLALSGGALSGSALLAGQFAAEHLTLQACSVGRVVTSISDDIWGPTRAALLNGADSVLAPMWDVDLESSTHLLEAFYTRWLVDGQDKSLAFAEAQRDMWRAAGPEAWRHMYHWAAFKLTGV
ncbi:CHAT domain-containing protein [Nonomuraea dietziae]|uniref:CHAT domain-containing protein n=1 Tax=Nonomuraea dietziae TaxID=65515 RepID=UPI00340926F0